KCGVGLQKPRLPANTFGRHCSIELYRQSQYTLSSPIVITAHQGACAFAGCRPTNTLARAAMVAKIKRVIVSLHAQCRNNTERAVNIRRLFFAQSTGRADLSWAETVSIVV